MVVGPHSLAVGSGVDVVAGWLGGCELQVDRESRGGPEAVEDHAGFKACGLGFCDLGVTPDWDDAVRCGVIVGRWEEGRDWEGIPPFGEGSKSGIGEVVCGQADKTGLDADVVGCERL